MKKWKIVFNQTLMISTGILFGLGVQKLIEWLCNKDTSINWPWYIPLSIILTGFLCALATLFLIDRDGENVTSGKIRIVLHFIFLLIVVAGCGWLFGWYSDLTGFIVIAVMYVLIYAFVWISSLWMAKTDEKKINEAIRDIQDEE